MIFISISSYLDDDEVLFLFLKAAYDVATFDGHNDSPREVVRQAFLYGTQRPPRSRQAIMTGNPGLRECVTQNMVELCALRT